MRINIALPSFPVVMTGGYKVMLEYANMLAARGHDVQVYFVISLPHSRPYRPAWYLYLKSLWLKHRRPDWFPLSENIACKAIYKLNKSNVRDADVLFFTQCLLAIEADNLPNCKGTKVNLIQDYEEWILPDKDMLDASFKTADQNIVIADYLVDIVEKACGKRPAVLYNAIHAHQFHLTVPIAQRARYKVGMLYHEETKKGCRYGLDALRQCRERFPELEAELFGVYPDPGFAEPWIHYTRKPKDLCTLYNSCAIFLTPSLNEGWGLTATEAMSCGCALVATDTDGLRVFAHEGETALLAPTANAEALASRICELLENDDLRQRLAETGRQYVQQFTWERATDRLLQILNDSKANR